MKITPLYFPAGTIIPWQVLLIRGTLPITPEQAEWAKSYNYLAQSLSN